MSRTSDKELLRLAAKTYKTGVEPIDCLTYDYDIIDNNEKVTGCCVVGAACLAKTKKCFTSAVSLSKVFHRSDAFIMGVMAGFDGSNTDETNCYSSGSRKTAFIRGLKLGAKARKRFLK